MSGPYTKIRSSLPVDDDAWWTILDAAGEVVAYTKFERPANVLLAALTGFLDVDCVGEYPIDDAQGDDEPIVEADGLPKPVSEAYRLMLYEEGCPQCGSDAVEATTVSRCGRDDVEAVQCLSCHNTEEKYPSADERKDG